MPKLPSAITTWMIQRRDAAATRWVDELRTNTENPTGKTKRREKRAQRRLAAWDTMLTTLARR